MKEKTKFCLLLKQLRTDSGLTQKQVADALNLERSTYSYYETGTTKPHCSFVLELSKIFNVDYKMFMDAIADTTFDEIDDGNGFTTLTDEPPEIRNKIYEITKSEQALVLTYRMMTAEQKHKLMKNIGRKQM